jgi:hypothetical protein
VLADPREVVLTEGRPRDDAKAVFREPGDGEVAFDPAPRVEHLRVRHLADLARDPVPTEPLEKLRRPFARHADLRERALVEDRGRLAARDVLRADRG